MLQRIITWSFYILFFFIPLFFTKYNHELFEYNKMMLVYGLTVIVTTFWLLKMLKEKRFILGSTPLDLPIVIFYLSQVLSTIFSIDSHTSIWGYYTRSNGGLLSITSYILLFYALVSNFEVAQALKFLKAALFGGFLVALYAIPEHFGVSPSCVIMVHEFTASCWVQDVQARVFATLGQPNWLAAYLAMLIFPAIYFAITEAGGKEFLSAIKGLFKVNDYTDGRVSIIVLYFSLIKSFFWFFYLIVVYMAFTFTYSRGAMIGFLVGLGVFVVLHFGRTKLLAIASLFSRNDTTRSSSSEERVEKFSTFKPFLIIILIFFLINIYFGSALTSFKLEKFSAPPRPAIIGSGGGAGGGGGTQLENGGTESGQIRLIVWRGALDIFKHYPLLGSGVETFAYSYYQFRPVEHNLVSEWDFLYNKAHNEYLNYLATTGILGFGAYLLIIGTFIYWSFKRISNLIVISLLASYTSYLVQNFFGFSVVMIAMFFFLFPALAFIFTEQVAPLKLPDKKYLFAIPLFFSKKLADLGMKLSRVVYKRKMYQKSAAGIIFLISFYFLLTLVRYWRADTFYKLGSDYEDAGNIKISYEYLVRAVNLNKFEPLYRSDLGFITAAAASGYADKDATFSAQLKEDAISQTNLALSISPANVSLWRTAIRTYYELSSIDASFEKKTLEVMDHTISLAPTDPKLYYNKALILSQNGKNAEAVDILKQTIKLKQNYREAYLTLGSIYTDLKQKDQAKLQYEAVLKMIPNDTDALKGLEELK